MFLNESAMSTYEYPTKYHVFCGGFIFWHGGFIYVFGWLIIFDESATTHKWIRLKTIRIRHKNYDSASYFLTNSYFWVADSLRHMVDSFLDVADSFNLVSDLNIYTSPPCRINESGIIKNESGRTFMTPPHILWRIHNFRWRIHKNTWRIHFLWWRIHFSFGRTHHFRRVRHDIYMNPS